MARNVQPIAPEKYIQGDRLEPEGPFQFTWLKEDSEPSPGEKKTITPLHKLLNDIPLEKLLSVLQSLNATFTLTGRGFDCHPSKQYFHCTIWGKGIVKYQSGGQSPQQALLNVLVKFFAGEKKDIHEYK